MLFDLGRGEQARLVVVPQRDHAQLSHPGEVPDGQADGHRAARRRSRQAGRGRRPVRPAREARATARS